MPFTEDQLLSISALQHLLYCPRQCTLIHLEQVWATTGLPPKVGGDRLQGHLIAPFTGAWIETNRERAGRPRSPDRPLHGGKLPDLGTIDPGTTGTHPPPSIPSPEAYAPLPFPLHCYILDSPVTPLHN
jgi:hypothetical protein